MSQKHIDVIRDQYTATNERDFDRAMAHYTADVELLAPPEYIRAGEFKGRDDVGAWFGDWLSSFDRDARFDVKELTEFDDGTVLLVAEHRARGRLSGVAVRRTVVWVYRFRGDKIARAEGYPSREEAIEAALVRE